MPSAAKLADEFDRARHLAVAQSGERFVEQDQFGLQAERAGDFEPPQDAERQIARELILVAVEMRPPQQRARHVAMWSSGGYVAAPRRSSSSAHADRGEHVLENGELAERTNDLKGASDAEPRDPVGLQLLDRLALEDDLARGARDRTAEQVEECRLAGAVRADHAEDLAGTHLEADVVHRGQAGEPACEVTDLQHTSARWPRRSECASSQRRSPRQT